jgi:hypothetical protein
VTQQNAAVVGQAAAAAENLSGQAQDLITAVARFKLDDDKPDKREPRAPPAAPSKTVAPTLQDTPRRPTVTYAPQLRPVSPALPGASAHGDGEWKEF